MKLSKSTNYALHSMLHLAMSPSDKAVSVEILAKYQSLSPTYLSKILTRLAKADLVESTPGAKGGYRLLKAPEQCTFLDIIQATEGNASLLNCTLPHKENTDRGCLIEKTMNEVEGCIKEEFAKKTIGSLLEQAQKHDWSLD